MNEIIIEKVEQKLKVQKSKIQTVVTLLSEGNTVPFIARYRKDATGNLNEDEIREIDKVYQAEVNLEKRREEVMRLINEKGMLNAEIKEQIIKASKLQTLEDIYLPFKEKRKTKATEAIKNGFEPLAKFMRTYPKENGAIAKEAKKYLNNDFLTVDAALEQAGYIIAEEIADKAMYRDWLRKNMQKDGMIETKLKRGADSKEEAYKYEMYYDFKQLLKKLPSYRILAVNRGEKDKIINVKITLDEKRLIENIYKFETRKYKSDTDQYLEDIINDSYKRLILPSIEREIRKELTIKADQSAIKLFADNLEKLITEAPVKDQMILGVDPAYRTGCKLAVIDENSQALAIDVIYQNKPQNKVEQAIKIVKGLCQKYDIKQIVIGNGTASRETERFFKENAEAFGFKGKISIVSEAGASVYSASKIAKDEFPDLQVEQRSAISIARRVQDPMAELVKIEPKAIGVGQYQHDVNQKELAESLDFTMLKTINQVGVDLNTASRELLKYVSGLDATIAKNIVEYRNENGAFKSRKELLKVKRLGPKAYEQAAGFLKITDGKEALDQTFIHPESYPLTREIMSLIATTDNELGSELIAEKIEKNYQAIYELSDNHILIKDIIKALKQPNLDIREKVNAAEFSAEIQAIEDVKVGMKIPGQVRNIVEFGAFVDIGIKNDGLVHISALSNNFVKDVRDVVNIGDIKLFTVLEVDEKKKRVQLSLREK